jgi:hypothetical protein
MKLTIPLAICLLTALPTLARAGGSKSADVEKDPPKKEKNNGDWCDWLSDDPGTVYDVKKGDNPWFQELTFTGRFQYQAFHVSGTDVRGNDFSDSHDEYRRFRLGADLQFLQYFHSEISLNLVDDGRFRSPSEDLDWGYDDFDTLTMRFDIGDLYSGWFDDIELTYGRMKLRVGEEDHESSRRILTIERSALSSKIAGDEGRPTGAVLELEKDDWEILLGLFSGEVDETSLAGWGAGRVYYSSVAWQATDDFRLLVDYVQNDPDGGEDFLGYSWAVSVGGQYEADRWGMMVNLVYGDNGGAAHGRPDPIQQGDFHGAVVMPWYWVVEDRLQVRRGKRRPSSRM